MSTLDDTYKTIMGPSQESLFKDRNSKFYGYAFPIQTEADIKKYLESLRKKHHTAGHHCYAWQLGTDKISHRANDDGEPNNSAGQPIYGQIQAFGLTNILIVSVRYFGGTKLGVGGLINAYRTSARMAIEASEVIEKTIDVVYQLNFGYDRMNKVMRIIKEKSITVLNQKLELECMLVISIRKKEAEAIHDIFMNLFKVSIKKV
ncbi:YigZ family protein [Tenacibaculum sp. SG-28]|uniref:IMPACT family protein n=1 Tax=Tenacibaculum sp. SG-28 TaxID=754426 RepID=UPI000CF5379D|nr:YigZ family protein [Tenacibaculum sp. SG-28]PQJ23395.1 YigZ family protein [Tenacibaculum sp. SG-28]